MCPLVLVDKKPFQSTLSGYFLKFDCIFKHGGGKKRIAAPITRQCGLVWSTPVFFFFKAGYVDTASPRGLNYIFFHSYSFHSYSFLYSDSYFFCYSDWNQDLIFFHCKKQEITLNSVLLKSDLGHFHMWSQIRYRTDFLKCALYQNSMWPWCHSQSAFLIFIFVHIKSSLDSNHLNCCVNLV